MREELNSTREFKCDIVAKLFNEYPRSFSFTEQEYGCYLFDSRDLYLNPDSDDTLEAIERARLLTQSFRELKSKGIVQSQRVSHMGWSARLTPFGFYCLRKICSDAELSVDKLYKKILNGKYDSDEFEFIFFT